MPLRDGEVFAGYMIVRRLGAGGMGEVYLAGHPRLPRQDALKLLKADTATDPSFRDRFLREADLAAALRHPNIVGVLDRGDHDGQLWIAMDYVEGQDAGQLLAHSYPTGMPADLVGAIVTAVASALDYAHRQRLLHRDVKPANILIASPDTESNPIDRRILLGDFGIARTMDDHSSLTATNMTVGTMDYISPEQLMGEHVDGRADQYALAATAYHLLTGSPIFKDSNVAVVIGRHLNAQPPTLSAVKPDLAALDRVLQTALAKDPAARYPSCTAFAQAFTTALAQDAPADTLLAPTPAAAPGIPPQPLAPGWYAGANGLSSYWDGHSWRSDVTPPPAQAPAAPAAPTSAGRRSPLVLVLAIVIPVLLAVAGALGWALTRGASSSAPPSSAPTAAPYSEAPQSFPSEIVSSSPTTTSTQAPRSTAGQNTATTAVGVIQGTCDEGGSCGVKQRNAPYTDAPRLHPNDLHDGTTVTLVCQTIGDVRSNSGVGSSRTWYKLDNGAYVNSVYVGTSTTSLPSC